MVVKMDDEGIMHGDADMMIKGIRVRLESKTGFEGKGRIHCEVSSCIKQSFVMHAEPRYF